MEARPTVTASTMICDYETENKGRCHTRAVEKCKRILKGAMVAESAFGDRLAGSSVQVSSGP